MNEKFTINMPVLHCDGGIKQNILQFQDTEGRIRWALLFFKKALNDNLIPIYRHPAHPDYTPFKI